MKINTTYFHVILTSPFGPIIAVDGGTGNYYVTEGTNKEWKGFGREKRKAYEWYGYLCRKAVAERNEKTKFIKKKNPFLNPFEGLKNFKF